MFVEASVAFRLGLSVWRERFFGFSCFSVSKPDVVVVMDVCEKRHV